MQSITIKSPAKINLYLNILGKRRDGYHELESLMVRVSLFDRLSIAVNSTGRLSLKCSNPKLVPNNTIIKAHELLKKYVSAEVGADVYLEKNIPVGSGLGGASSNAAFYILGVLKALKRELPQKKLYEIGEQVGSDVNFFLSQSSYAVCTGRGEKIRPVSIAGRYRLTIIFPKIFSSTKAVYSRLYDHRYSFDEVFKRTGRGSLNKLEKKTHGTPTGLHSGCSRRLTSDFNNVNILLHGLRKKDYSFIENGIFNALKPAAYAVSPRLARVEKLLNALPAQVCNMTGSGSAFFIFDKGIEKKTTLSNLCRREEWMMYTVRTF